MKWRILSFEENKIPRFFTVENPEPYQNIATILINPDLKDVVGVPQHFWKQDENDASHVIQMDDDEKKAVLERLALEKGSKVQPRVIFQKEYVSVNKYVEKEVPVYVDKIVEIPIEKIVPKITVQYKLYEWAMAVMAVQFIAICVLIWRVKNG